MQSRSVNAGQRIKTAVPAGLLGLPCWVGRIGKIPQSPRGGAAKSNDPKTWGTFEEAAEGLQRFKEWDGLGLMFDAARYGIFGVDLDHVIDRKTGAVDERAAAVVEALGSYAEISPSGTGVHILCKGRLPTDGGKGIKTDWLEAYEAGLIPQAAALPAELGQRFEASRQWARERLPGSHGRQAEAVAWLLEGYRMALDYWVSVGAIEAQERAELWEAGRLAVLENTGAQSEDMKEEDPVDIFLQALKELLQSGAVRVADMNRQDYGGAGLIGYRGEGFVYLLPMAAYGAVQKHLETAGEILPVSRQTLWKRLKERGALGLVPGGKTSALKWIGGTRTRLIPLYAAALGVSPEQLHA